MFIINSNVTSSKMIFRKNGSYSEFINFLFDISSLLNYKCNNTF